eukprot:m.91616 g.91616  ORF g.91616 m.91616 type:complete len:330 (-) comp21665_c0_seq1:53-1042(-)
MKPVVAVAAGPSFQMKIEDVDPAIRAGLQEHVELIDYNEAVTLAETKVIDGVLCLCHAPITGELLDSLSKKGKVKVVSNYGVGVDHIDLAACRERGVVVGNTPGVLSHATADMAWALLMACARQICQAHSYACGPEYTEYKNMVYLGRDVYGKTLGVLGMGRIGTEVARRSTGFGMKVLYHNRSRKEAAEKEVGATYVSFDELLQQSDFFVIVCPCTAETKNLINAAALKKMKNSAILINIARGPIVNHDDLAKALQNKEIDSAGLDVSSDKDDHEPIERSHPLNKLPNVIFAPHRGSATRETRDAMQRLTVENLLCGLNGKELKAQVS